MTRGFHLCPNNRNDFIDMSRTNQEHNKLMLDFFVCPHDTFRLSLTSTVLLNSFYFIKFDVWIKWLVLFEVVKLNVNSPYWTKWKENSISLQHNLHISCVWLPNRNFLNISNQWEKNRNLLYSKSTCGAVDLYIQVRMLQTWYSGSYIQLQCDSNKIKTTSGNFTL